MVAARDDEDRLIKTEEAARLLGLSAKTLRFYATVGGGPLPPVRLGRAVRYRLSDVRRVVAMGAAAVDIQKRSPGRPRKAEQLRKQEAA